MTIIESFKNILMETLGDNKRLIIGLYALFIIMFIVSWIFSSEIVAANIDQIINSGGVSGPSSGEVSAIDLFIHNESSGIMVYFGSIFFAIMAFASIIYNAINLGMVGALLSSLQTNGALLYILYLIPHGIFEITGTIIQSVAGILLFRFLWNFVKSTIGNHENGWGSGLSQSFEKNKKLLIQSIVLMIFATVLLLIAAPMEAHVSYEFSRFIVGLL